MYTHSSRKATEVVDRGAVG